jgi:hypothetical protein
MHLHTGGQCSRGEFVALADTDVAAGGTGVAVSAAVGAAQAASKAASTMIEERRL